jgi:PST family polysaccharide transporter
MKPAWVKLLPRSIREKVEGRPTLLRATHNSGWLFFDKIVRLGFGLFVSVWVARYLGPKQFGLLSYAFALVALFSVIAKLGLDGIVVRNLVRNPEYKENLLGTAFILKLLSGIGTFLLVVFVINILRPENLITFWLIAIIALGIIFQAFDVIDFWFQSQVESQYVVIPKCFAFITASITKVILILYQAPLIYFAYVALGEIILGSIGLILTYYWRGMHIFDWRPIKKQAQSLIKDSWPLIAASLAIALYMKIDQVMLGEMINDKEVGIYSAAVKISEIWYFIPMVIISSITPALIKTRSKDEDLYYKHLSKVFKFMVLFALIITIPISFTSETIIASLFGDNYSDAAPILFIHAWATIFVFLGVAQSQWFLNEGLMSYSMYRSIGGAICNIFLNLMLIPKFGGIGAAIATVISYSFSSIIFNLFNKKTRKIFFLQLQALNPIEHIKCIT